MLASSASVQSQRTSKTSAAGTFTNSAKAPSKSEPIQMLSIELKPRGRMQARTNTRRPTSAGSTSGAVATTRPQQSVPWMNGKGVAMFQPPSGLWVGRSSSAAAAALVAVVTDEEYQPRRVLISVLFTPAASTRSSTSPGPIVGTGTSHHTRRS